MAIQWIYEACDLKPDPVSGAKIARLTNAVAISNNVYCEQPYTSPDGKRIAVVRFWGLAPDYETAMYVADLESILLTRVRGVKGGSNSAWGEWWYYVTEGKVIEAFSLITFERKVILSNVSAPGFGIGSVSQDQRYTIYLTVLPGPTFGIVRFDLQTGEWKVIFEHKEICNPHLQFNPVHGKDIMVQHNRGCIVAEDGTTIKSHSEQGTTLFVIDRDGNNYRQVPAGPPYTAGCTGHECFVADTGMVAFTVSWDQGNWKLDSKYPEGNLFTAKPGDTKPTVFPTPNHLFNHVCISKCGTYFVCDCYAGGIPGKIPIVIGNLKTGKHRTLLQDCGASCGGAQYVHPHPYITADNRHVIYNADPRGIPHVFKAEIPKGFLENLG